MNCRFMVQQQHWLSTALVTSFFGRYDRPPMAERTHLGLPSGLHTSYPFGEIMLRSITPKAAATLASLAAVLALSACSDTTTSPKSLRTPAGAPAFTIGPTSNVGPVQVTFASSGTTQFCSSATQTGVYTVPASLAPIAGCGTAFDLESNLVNTYNPGWNAPLTGSDWIGPSATSNEYRLAPGSYVFQTQFSIPAGVTNPVLNDTLMSDNAVAVYLNGNKVEAQTIQDCPASPAGGCNWQTTHKFVISDNTLAHFVIGGTNTITVLLVDTPIGYPNGTAPNYMCSNGPQAFGWTGFVFDAAHQVATVPNHAAQPWSPTIPGGCLNPGGVDFSGSVSWVVPAPPEGCSPGYYKNHAMPGGSLFIGSVFTNSGYTAGAAPTLHDALFFTGGPTLQDAKNILLRQAAAAYANSIRLAGYPLTTAQVVAMTDAALASGDRSTILALADVLNTDNNLEGPNC
jgi:hypothetical protein